MTAELLFAFVEGGGGEDDEDDELLEWLPAVGAGATAAPATGNAAPPGGAFACATCPPVGPPGPAGPCGVL